MTNQPTYNYIGIDVAKRSFDVHSDAYRNLTKSYSSTRKQLDAFAARLAKKDNAFVVCEATGNYELPLLKALEAHDIPYARLNPRKARDFARAKGFLAKTDRVDAKVLAQFGATFKPEPSKPLDPVVLELQALLDYRLKLIEDLHREKMQLEHEQPPVIRTLVKTSIKTL